MASPSATSAPPDATRVLRQAAIADGHQHQPDRSGRGPRGRSPVRTGRGMPAALRANVPNPFFGIPGTGEFGARPTIQAGQLLRPFPQFGDVFEFEITDGGRRQYHAATFVLEKRTTELVGRAVELYAGAAPKTTSSGRPAPTRPGRHCRRTTTISTPSTASATSTRRTASSWRRSSGSRIPASGGDRGPVPRRLECVGGGRTGQRLAAERGACRPARPTSNLGLFGGRQRPNLVGDPNTDGQRRRPGGRSRATRTRGTSTQPRSPTPEPGTFGNAPRTDGDARYQFRKNIDLVIAKDTTIFGNHVGQIRFEILNLTNTAKFRGIDTNAVDSTAFGQHHAAGRVHADLAVELPLHVLSRDRDRDQGSGIRDQDGAEGHSAPYPAISGLFELFSFPFSIFSSD